MLSKKSDAYEMLPLMWKLQFDAHMLAHRQGIAELVQTQVAVAQASAPGGGAGSQPKVLGKASQPSMKGQSSEGKGPPTP